MIEAPFIITVMTFKKEYRGTWLSIAAVDALEVAANIGGGEGEKEE
jgi:hypothetical protein